MSRDRALPHDVAALLDSEREIPPAPPGAYERVQTRLHATLSAGLGTTAGAIGSSSGVAGGTVASKPILAALLAVLGTSAVIAYVVLRQDGHDGSSGARIAPTERAPAVQNPLPPPPQPVPPPPASSVVPAPPAAGSDASAPLGVETERVATRKPRPDERAILDEARRCLARREAPCALSAVAVHARHYPKGTFSEERDAIQVEALDLSGNADAAQDHARRFLARYPNSVHATAIRRVLQSP